MKIPAKRLIPAAVLLVLIGIFALTWYYGFSVSYHEKEFIRMWHSGADPNKLTIIDWIKGLDHVGDKIDYHLGILERSGRIRRMDIEFPDVKYTHENDKRLWGELRSLEPKVFEAEGVPEQGASPVAMFALGAAEAYRAPAGQDRAGEGDRGSGRVDLGGHAARSS